MLQRFTWRSFDLNSLLPRGWQEDAVRVAQTQARPRVLRPRSVTSREGDPDLRLSVATVDGSVVRSSLPWLYELYHGLFCQMAQLGTDEPVSAASNVLHGVVLNVQQGKDVRYESHVDSNPIEGLLYVTDHAKGAGGELVVANKLGVENVTDIEADCSVIYPVAGNLLFFDARCFAHYVRPLREDAAIRVVAAMNYYTPSCPESARPPDLDAHLLGEAE